MNWYRKANEIDQAAKRNGYTIGPVWHGGTFSLEEGNTIFEDWSHFGTKEAAEERTYGSKIIDDRIRSIETFQDPRTQEWYYEMEGIESIDSYSTQQQAQKAAENEAVNVDYYDPPEAQFTQVYLYGKYFRTPDLGIEQNWEPLTITKYLPQEDRLTKEEKTMIHNSTDPRNKLSDILLSKGYNGIVYRNQIENKGQDSYIVFKTNFIKSAEPITYDQDKPIPLSERFNINNKDIRY